MHGGGGRWYASGFPVEVSEAAGAIAAVAIEGDTGGTMAVIAAASATADSITRASTVITIRSCGTTGCGWDYGDSGYGYPTTDIRTMETGIGLRCSFLCCSQPAGIGHFQSNAPSAGDCATTPGAGRLELRPDNVRPQKYQDPLFLLAMNDGTIRAVLAYWVDGATVHYVTMDHEQKQTPLSSLDHSLSERLNRERNVTFRLPG